MKEYGKTIIYYVLLLTPVVHFSIKANIEHLNVVKSMYLGKCLTVIAMTDFSETQPLQSNYIFKEIERTTMMVDNAKTKYSKRKQPTILPIGKLC